MQPPPAAAPELGGGPKDGLRAGKTDLPSPLALKQRELVKQAVQAKLQGKLPKDAKIAKVGNDKTAKGNKKDKARASSSSRPARARTRSGRS